MYIFPMFSNGLSTVFAPIHVRIVTTAVNLHTFVFFVRLNFVGFLLLIVVIAMIRIDVTRAKTPPSFDGIDRRIT